MYSHILYYIILTIFYIRVSFVEKKRQENEPITAETHMHIYIFRYNSQSRNTQRKTRVRWRNRT